MYCNFETGSCLTGNMDANDFTAIFGLSDSEVNVNEQYLSILTELDWTCLWSEQYLERTELDWTSSEGLSCVLCGLNWTAPVFTFSAMLYHVNWTGLHLFLPSQQCLIIWTETVYSLLFVRWWSQSREKPLQRSTQSQQSCNSYILNTCHFVIFVALILRSTVKETGSHSIIVANLGDHTL